MATVAYMPLVTLLCGPAGAGKTTYALELVAKGAHRLSMDEAVWADGWGEQQPPAARLVELHDALQDDLRRAVGEGRDVVSTCRWLGERSATNGGSSPRRLVPPRSWS